MKLESQLPLVGGGQVAGDDTTFGQLMKEGIVPVQSDKCGWLRH